MPENQKPDAVDQMVDAYNRMLKHTHDAIVETGKETVPRLRELIEKTRDHMVELGELTREEGAKVAGYLERDLKDAAAYIANTGEGLREWWRFDLKLMEDRMLDMFASVADQTSLQLREWAEAARRASVYRTGEVTGQGSLACVACGHELHFSRPGHIPPCPACQGTEFKRPVAEVDDFAEGDDDGTADGD